jgi:hypothetical protein
MPTPTFPEWSRSYSILSISKVYLSALGYSYDQINSLSDDDMKHIAELLHQYALVGFERIVRLAVDCHFLQTSTDTLSGGQHEC